MGSLMAGWDSLTLDPESATIERNRSLTKEEINAFWKTKKEAELEHLKALSKLSETIRARKCEYSENSHRSSTATVALGMDGDKKSLENLIKKNCWWTKSSWAFLNEPPVIEAASNKYASQFQVANLGSTKFNPGDGITTIERNRSLTKEEIDAYWRAKKETELEHLRAISKLSETIQTRKCEDSENSHKSSTVTLASIKESLGMDVDQKSLEQLIKKNGWWTKSNWAFLNEPPVIEAASNELFDT
ncbi:hypothetical protein GmHk_06G014983 [Glycine max]|nr:hypothetical protein GmHk_06G014983 [Glycine max]